MIWGAALAAGAEAYRRYGKGPEAETRAVDAAKGLVESFRKLNQHINCLEITEIDKSSSAMQIIKFFLIKGGTIACIRMAAKYAPVAFDQINSALTEKHIEVPAPPVSCSSIVAQKMGASDMQTVMAAGFAGGIGLSGGACGALGAAIWMSALKSSKSSGGKVDFKDPGAMAAIDRFLKCTDCEFECSAIVGRKFNTIEDHASYIRDGGCSKLLELLATD
jgi:hypothetical protein